MNLPEALEPWADAFAVVAPDVALSLGPSVARLASAVGPLRTRSLVGSGDPDGYDGLTRRGSYERLLLSEWALIDVAPDEFLRRAATRELGFHQWMFRETAKARASVALFDAGPTELGSPRIAHLALLLLLSQRARDAGARFAWGVLQMPPGSTLPGAGLRLDVTPDNIDGLRVMRSPMRTADSDLDAWVDLERRGGPWDDLWIIGPSDVARRWQERVARRQGTTGGAIEVRESDQPGARVLAASVRQRSTTRDVSLDLPPSDVCVRLLRNPLRRVDPPKPTRTGRTHTTVPNHTRPVLSNPLLFASGSKAVARTTDGALLVFGVPGSSRGGTPRPRIIMPRPGERIIAAGWGSRRLVMLSSYMNSLRLHDWNGNIFPWSDAYREATPEVIEALFSVADDATNLANVFVHRVTPASVRTASMLDLSRRLWRLDPEGVKLQESDVAAAYVRDEELVTARASVDGDAPRLGVFPALMRLGFAVSYVPGEWKILPLKATPTSDAFTRVPLDATVLGVARFGGKPAPPMVALEGDRVTIALYEGTERRVMFKSPTQIVRASLEVFGARVAYSLEGGGLGVFDLTRSEELMRYAPGGWR